MLICLSFFLCVFFFRLRHASFRLFVRPSVKSYIGCLVSATPLTIFVFWSPCLGRGMGWSLCLSCICLLAMHTLICVAFSLPPGVGGWLRLLLVAIPGLFCLPFCIDLSKKNRTIPCERNSSNNFIPIFLKLCRCFAMVWRCAYDLDIILEFISVTFSNL